jgi:hypothetical protein
MKILKPVNLDLESLIKDEQLYSWHKNHQRKLTIAPELYKGKNLRKYIPQFYYLISMILINSQNEYNKCDVSGYGDHIKVRLGTLDEVGINYFKARQLIQFLINQKIISVKGVFEPTQVQNQTFYINTRYFKLLPPFNGKTEIYDIDLNFKRMRINKVLETKLFNQPFLRHQYDKQCQLKYDLPQAEKFVNNLFYSNLINDRQFISYYNLFKRIENKRFHFHVSDKCDRVFTTINSIPRILRPYIVDHENLALKELDFSGFNVMILFKIFQEYINTHEVDDRLKTEFQKYQSFTQNDFYNKIVEFFDENMVKIDRDIAKDIVLHHWINANQSCKTPEFKIMKSIFPELTKLLIKFKGINYSTYKEFYNGFMREESKLINEIIYSRIIKEYPDCIVYTIFDGLLVEDRYAKQVQEIMLDEGKKFINHNIKVKIK